MTGTGPERNRRRRRKFRGWLGGTVFLVGLLAHMILIEPRWLRVREVRVPVAGLSAPVRILQLSDLHASPAVSLRYIARAVALGLALRPDVVCLTGDYITHRTGLPDMKAYADVLRPLSSNTPAFACLGNHDGGVWSKYFGGPTSTAPVQAMLESAGIQVLNDEAARVQIRDQTLALIGLSDLWSGQPELARAFAGAPTGLPRIVMAHNPFTVKLIENQSWDLLLCGHTHGGQVRIPWFGAPVAPVREKRLAEGLCWWRSERRNHGQSAVEIRPVFVTRGVGNLAGLRLNCRPEVVLIALEPPASEPSPRMP